MNKPIYIGMIGATGAGKDTVALAMVEGSEGQLVTDSFAHPIRETSKLLGLDIYSREFKESPVEVKLSVQGIAQALDKATGNALEGFQSLKVASKTMEALLTLTEGKYRTLGAGVVAMTISPRQFAQLLGTEGGRAVDQYLWMNLLATRVESRFSTEGVRTVVTDVRFLNEALLMDSLVYVQRPDNPHATQTTHVSENLAQLVEAGTVPLGVGRRLVARINNRYSTAEDLALFVQGSKFYKDLL